MQHNYRWLNRTRLNVQVLECRVQPGSWLMNGLIEMGMAAQVGGRQDREPQAITHNVRIAPAAVQRAAAESTPDTVTHPAQLFDHGQLRTVSFADAGLADPLALGTSRRSRMVRQRADSGEMARHGGITDAAAPSADVSVRHANHAVNLRPADKSAITVPIGFTPASSAISPRNASDAQKHTIAENYGQLPLSFEQNVGQFDDRVDFVARTGGMTTFLTPTAAVFAIQNSETKSESRPLGSGLHSEPLAEARGSERIASPGVALYMEMLGGNPDARAVGGDLLPGIVNYFIGNDPSQWHTIIATFGRVAYQDVYPGIDLVYYGNNGTLEYDFIVSPGADPNAIILNVAGAAGLELDPQDNLVLHTAAGHLVQQRPLTYQQEGADRKEIASRYVVEGTNVRFEIGAYNPTQPLVIDPLVLGYSTYLGGSDLVFAEQGHAIAVDSAGNAYVAGTTQSTKFPTTPGAFDTSYNGSYDVFVAKLGADGASLSYGTYLGGADEDRGRAIALDAAGNACVTGWTVSTNLPTTPEAFDTTYNGGSVDAFVAKLSGDGASLVYGTYLGGSAGDVADGLAVDAAGEAYVSGATYSTDFPTTSGAFDTSHNGETDVIVAKLSADGTSLVYATYLGGSDIDESYGIAVDAAGNAHVTGVTFSASFPSTPGALDTSLGGTEDAFLTKLSPAGDGLVYSTYLGGSSEDSAFGIALDAAGNAYLTGSTSSTNFPTTPGAFDTNFNGADGFVAKLSPAGTQLAYGTYLGASGVDVGLGIAVDAAGNAYVTGRTASTNFPTTPGAFDTTFNGFNYDAFLAKLNAPGSSLVYGTYLGGNVTDVGYGIAVDAGGNTYATGETDSTTFPTTPGALKRRNRGTYDAFVTKFAEV